MDVRILDLDGSVAEQPALRERASEVVPLRDWEPKVRLACSWSEFRRFEADLFRRTVARPTLTFVGSGDFHHVTLALLRRIEKPFHLLVLDNHPDWMRGVPLLHCGTWLRHAARLPNVRRVYHVGGEVDFDNHYRWLAPWPELQAGKIVVMPARRRFERGRWKTVAHRPLVMECLGRFRDDLARLPLYVSLDRDVLRADEAAVNWDSGQLGAEEALSVLDSFLSMSAGSAGADIVGDWSPVRVHGWLRHFLHWAEHPREPIDTTAAQALNERFNLRLVELLSSHLAKHADQHTQHSRVRA